MIGMADSFLAIIVERQSLSQFGAALVKHEDHTE
jgi:hypothetical protein